MNAVLKYHFAPASTQLFNASHISDSLQCDWKFFCPGGFTSEMEASKGTGESGCMSLCVLLAAYDFVLLYVVFN